MRHLVWFRRDLRVRDNTALHEACRAADGGVVGAFVICPEEWRNHDDAPIKIDFWMRNLRELSAALARLNIPLVIAEAQRTNQIAPRLLAIAKSARCDALYYNHEYEVNESRRDEAVARHLGAAGIRALGFHDHVVFDPASIRTGQSAFYTVFTPFKRAFIARIQREGFRILAAPKKQPEIEVKPSPVPDQVAGFEPSVDTTLWPAGEREAHRRLSLFCEERIRAYKEQRDMPALEGTSRLSPYLNSGAISPRQCLSAAREANGDRLDDARPGAPGPAQWISEIIWREFYQHVLVGFPRVSMGRAFKPATDRITWNQNPDHFARWCEGRTGVPIVDAAMRQLLATGWMHNRLRMIAAMYLTKDLFLDWRLGERHFMHRLIDGDLGSNNGGWQWSASTGTDAAPYFRIFNPYSQSKKCDPDGAFIRRWVPELAGIEGDAIHEPGTLPPLARSRLNYPEQIVDHARARARVMEAFQGIK